MARSSRQERVGATGVSNVMGDLQRIGWGPVENTRHDLGTDIFCQVRDARGFDLGALIGIQVKSGRSWFDSPVKDAAGTVTGWWYAESDDAHFSDWLDHQIPYLVALNDDETRSTYWAHVTASRIVPTGKGFKIVVPRGHLIDHTCLPGLLDAALSARPSNSLEGSVWSASANTLSPAKRLRYALLVPRLIAPHRNKGFAEPIGPEEAIALIMSGRPHDYERFAEVHPAVPDEAAARTRRRGLWPVVAATWDLVLGTDAANQFLEIMPRFSRQVERRAACVALRVAALIEEASLTAASELVNEEVASDVYRPMDQAWLTALQAAVRLERFDIAGGREAAARALALLSHIQDDITAGAIRSAASWILFSTSDPSSKDHDLSEVLASLDNAPNWWRQQQVSSALDRIVEDTYRLNTHDNSRQITLADKPLYSLLGGSVSALLAADTSASSTIKKRLGQYLLLPGIRKAKPI